VICEGSHRR